MCGGIAAHARVRTRPDARLCADKHRRRTAAQPAAQAASHLACRTASCAAASSACTWARPRPTPARNDTCRRRASSRRCGRSPGAQGSHAPSRRGTCAAAARRSLRRLRRPTDRPHLRVGAVAPSRAAARTRSSAAHTRSAHCGRRAPGRKYAACMRGRSSSLSACANAPFLPARQSVSSAQPSRSVRIIPLAPDPTCARSDLLPIPLATDPTCDRSH